VASLMASRLATLSGRIEFVILRTGRSPPAALHLASRRRSSSRFQAGARMPGGDLHPSDHHACRRTSPPLRGGLVRHGVAAYLGHTHESRVVCSATVGLPAEKGTGTFWAKPPSGLAGKTYLSPFPRRLDKPAVAQRRSRAPLSASFLPASSCGFVVAPESGRPQGALGEDGPTREPPNGGDSEASAAAPPPLPTCSRWPPVRNRSWPS
jgi:hypothetical protein